MTTKIKQEILEHIPYPKKIKKSKVYCKKCNTPLKTTIDKCPNPKCNNNQNNKVGTIGRNSRGYKKLSNAWKNFIYEGRDPSKTHLKPRREQNVK